MSRAKTRVLKNLAREALSLINRMQNDMDIVQENFKLALENRKLKDVNNRLNKKIKHFDKETERRKENSKILIDKLFNKSEDLQRENAELRAMISTVISKHENRIFKGGIVRDLREIVKSC